MIRPDIQPLREILHAALKRYLTVRPHGFELNPGETPRPILEVRILNTGAARTLYQNRKPRCRSLDGIAPLDDRNRTCAQCRLRPQFSVFTVFDGVIFTLCDGEVVGEGGVDHASQNGGSSSHQRSHCRSSPAW